VEPPGVGVGVEEEMGLQLEAAVLKNQVAQSVADFQSFHAFPL